MDEKIEETMDAVDEATDEAAKKLVAERKARKERHAELMAKCEELDGQLDRKHEAINSNHARYLHGLVDLTYFASTPSLRDRAQVERDALHKLIDESAAARKDYDACSEERNKLVSEANDLCKQIEKDEAGPWSGILGGILGGFGAYALGSAFSKAGAKKEPAPTEPAPPPESGGSDGGTAP